jgi:hypothetical protein
MFSTSGAETTLAGMGDQFNMPTASTLIDVATQNRTAAGQDLAHIFKNHRPDPSLVLGYELNPMRGKDGGNMISDMGGGAYHCRHSE